MSEQPAGLPDESGIPAAPDSARHGRRRSRSGAAAPVGAEGGASGIRNPKVLLLALGGVAILGVAGWAFVLPALTGSSNDTASNAPVVSHVPPTVTKATPAPAKTKAKPVPLLLAQDFAGVIGRDPFKALVVDKPAPAAAPAAGVPTAGSAPAPAAGTGASTSTQPAATRVELLSIYRTSKGVPHARIKVNSTVNDVVVDAKFGSFFQLNDIVDNYAVIQFGDATQVNLYVGEPRFFQN